MAPAISAARSWGRLGWRCRGAREAARWGSDGERRRPGSGRRSGRHRAWATRIAGSLGEADEQVWQAGEVIGRHSEGKLPADLGQSAMTHFAQPGHGLGPAESFLDAFTNALGNRVAGMAGRAAVDRRTTAFGVLRDMRGDGLLSQLHDKVASA